MYGVTLILTLAIIGGLISYIGDKIGMKVGRKRLTLFGLRPKHTSIIITIFTGIFIAGSSIIVLSIASHDVRTALFRMRSIQEALQLSQRQLEQSALQVAEMEDTFVQMIRERDRAAQELADVQLEMAEVTQEYDIVVADLERARQAVELERQRVDEFRQISQRLQLRVEELENRRADLEENIGYLLDEYAYLFDEYVKFTNQMRFGNVAFRSDEIIFAQVFAAGDDLEDISDRLFAFLEQADRVALSRGAYAEEGTDFALRLSQQVFDFAAQTLYQQHGHYVVRAVSKNNTLVGEPVITYLELIPNELVFLSGAILAETELDPYQVMDVDKQILTLLGMANEVAIEAGMITQEGAAVEVSGEDFLAAIAQAKEATNKITLRARAVEDTWSAIGPVRLDLEVEH